MTDLETTVAQWRSMPLLKQPPTLAATLRPDPDSRARRLSQWDSARRERYLKANAGLMREHA